MASSKASDKHYIRLSGLEFRSTEIVCPCCCWEGTAGQLKVVDLAAFCETLVYACPACREPIARHDGLTSAEVMCELEKVQAILTQEFSPTCNHTVAPSEDLTADYEKVRAEIQTVDPTELSGESDRASEDLEEGSTSEKESAPEIA